MIYYFEPKDVEHITDKDRDGQIVLGKANRALFGGKASVYPLGEVEEGPRKGKIAFTDTKGEALTAEDTTPIPPPVEQPPVLDDPFDILELRRDWWGVNIAGMEFASELSVKESDIDFYADAGVKSIRLPVKRDRLTTDAKLVALDKLIKRGTDRGILMVIDEHSYGNIGDPRIRDFWLRVGPRYKGQPLVAFDLQNEPNGGSWQTWGKDSRDLIHALRAAGIDNLLILEWRQSSGANRADKNEPAGKVESAVASLKLAGVTSLADLDPLKRTWLSPHRYFDSNGSGTSTYCRTDLSPKSAFGSSVTAAKKLGMKLYLGEFAWGRYGSWPGSCKSLAPLIVQYLRDTEEFVGGASWGWGPRWAKSYTFRGEHMTDRAKTWDTENGRLVRALWAD